LTGAHGSGVGGESPYFRDEETTGGSGLIQPDAFPVGGDVPVRCDESGQPRGLGDVLAEDVMTKTLSASSGRNLPRLSRRDGMSKPTDRGTSRRQAGGAVKPE
jgi:hypothetical protein